MMHSTSDRMSLGVALSIALMSIALSCHGSPRYPADPAPTRSLDVSPGEPSGLPEGPFAFSTRAQRAIAMQEQPAPRSGVTASAYKLPAHIAQSGILKVGLAPNSPPYFSNASGTITGLAKSIFDAVAHELGVTPEYTILNYSALVPALVAGKVDVAGVVFTDTLAREKQLDFIDYRISYRALLIQKGNPAHISGWNEICGHSVAVTAGAVSQTLSVKKSGECESNGKKPLKIIVLQDVPATQLAVANGRAEAYVTEAGLVPPLVKANPKLELGGEPFDPNYVGVGIKKGNTELSDVLMRAFTAYMRDGNYRQLMKEAGLESGIIDAPVFNAATTKPKK